MARYREKVLSLKPTVILLVMAFLFAFAPWTLDDPELSWREGYLVAQSQGVDFTPLPVVTVHGEAIPNAQPLFPMLAKFISKLGVPAELSTRVLSLCALLGLTAAAARQRLHRARLKLRRILEEDGYEV